MPKADIRGAWSTLLIRMRYELSDYESSVIKPMLPEQATRHSPGAIAKDPICFSPYLYRDRNLIERFFNKIKQCRRVATRYDKLAANDLRLRQARLHSFIAARLSVHGLVHARLVIDYHRTLICHHDTRCSVRQRRC